MLKARSGMLVFAAALGLSACQKQEAKAAPTINEDMTQVMEPTAQAVWDIMSNAYNDKGDGLVSTKISDADWKKLADATAQMKVRAEEMAKAQDWVVTAKDVPILGSQAVGQGSQAGPEWAAVGPEHVHKLIAAKPDLFRQKASDLAKAADSMLRAANGHNSTLLYQVGSQLDEVCDSCHEPFWGTDEPPPAAKL